MPENSWFHRTLINKSSSLNIHTYTEMKHHPRTNLLVAEQDKTCSFTSNSGTQLQVAQTHYKPIDTPKLNTGHLIALQRQEIQLRLQACLTRKPWQATSPTWPTASNLHNKEEPQTYRLCKSYPKHSNVNKVKRQRNIQQVKEHDKCSPNQTKQEEIGSLSEKDFRIMRVKMIQNLENKME